MKHLKFVLTISFMNLWFMLSAQVYFSVSTFAGLGSSGLFDANTSAALFDHPYGVCSDSSGTIYVADTYNHSIRKIKNGFVTTIVGNGQAGDVDAQGTNARLNFPTGVYFKNGYLYICDNINNKIKRVDTTGNVVTIAGSGSWSYIDGPALQAAFKEPKSLVVDSNNVIYVADYENHCIRKITNGQVTTLAGIGGMAGDQLGNALTAQFYRPRDLCIDNQGNLYVVDLMNHKVKKIDPSGNVSLIAGSGTQASIDGTGIGASFSTPVGIDWFPNGDLCVLDAWNPKIRRVTLSGVVTSITGNPIAGFMNGPVSSAQFNLPQDICFDSNGNLYVGDDLNNRIRVLPFGNPKGIEEILYESTSFSVFPNPSNNQVTIFNKDHITNPIEKIIVYSIDGEQVMEIINFFYEDKLSIDISNIPDGNYSLLIMTKEKRNGSFKIMHTH